MRIRKLAFQFNRKLNSLRFLHCFEKSRQEQYKIKTICTWENRFRSRIYKSERVYMYSDATRFNTQKGIMFTIQFKSTIYRYYAEQTVTFAHWTWICRLTAPPQHHWTDLKDLSEPLLVHWYYVRFYGMQCWGRHTQSNVIVALTAGTLNTMHRFELCVQINAFS